MLKQIAGRLIVVAVFLLIGFGYMYYTGKDSGADVSKKIMENFNNGDSLSFEEKYVGNGYNGTFIFKRDSDGNMIIIDQGTETIDGTKQAYYYESYKIGDVFYFLEDSSFVEYETDDGYFQGELDYISDFISRLGVDLFSDDYDADYKREGGFYVATGVYENSTETYTVKIDKKGKTMHLTDDTYETDLSFEFDDKIVLP